MSKCRGKVCNTYFQLPCSGLELTFSIEPRYTYAGWYSFSHSSYTSYHVYKIEGWTSNLSVNKLLNAGPFWNIDGEKLEVLNIGRGNVIHEKWSYIRNTLKCSVGLHLNTKNPKVGVTVGLRFTDVYGQVNTSAYT